MDNIHTFDYITILSASIAIAPIAYFLVKTVIIARDLDEDDAIVLFAEKRDQLACEKEGDVVELCEELNVVNKIEVSLDQGALEPLRTEIKKSKTPTTTPKKPKKKKKQQQTIGPEENDQDLLSLFKLSTKQYPSPRPPQKNSNQHPTTPSKQQAPKITLATSALLDSTYSSEKNDIDQDPRLEKVDSAVVVFGINNQPASTPISSFFSASSDSSISEFDNHPASSLSNLLPPSRHAIVDKFKGESKINDDCSTKIEEKNLNSSSKKPTDEYKGRYEYEKSLNEKLNSTINVLLDSLKYTKQKNTAMEGDCINFQKRLNELEILVKEKDRGISLLEGTIESLRIGNNGIVNILESSIENCRLEKLMVEDELRQTKKEVDEMKVRFFDVSNEIVEVDGFLKGVMDEIAPDVVEETHLGGRTRRSSC